MMQTECLVAEAAGTDKYGENQDMLRNREMDRNGAILYSETKRPEDSKYDQRFLVE